jgi:hypothetical protein
MTGLQYNPLSLLHPQRKEGGEERREEERKGPSKD